MNISFDRNRAQVKFEGLIGVRNPQDLPRYKTAFQNYSLREQDIEPFAEVLREDGKDFYFNALVSFAEGIDSVFRGCFSWATVKLYYSVFYSLRATLAIHNIALLRCASLYRLRIRAGEQPQTRSNRIYSSTHGGTIKHYEDIIGPEDKMLTNTIGDQLVYDWLKDVREIVNYKSVAFAEPDCLDIWSKFAPLDDRKLSKTLKELEDDDYIKCFQEEYAILAIPIKALSQTTKRFQQTGLLEQFRQDKDRMKTIKSIIKYESRNIEIYGELFGIP